MGYRFEFDAVNKILLLRVDGRVTDELLVECYEAIRIRSIATDARAGIFDFTSATDFPVSTEFIRRLAKQEPAMPEATVRPRVLVAPQIHAYGLVRMFQIMGEDSRPLLQVARTLDDAFAALGVRSPHFKPIP
ncbi:MAG: hypothetical protein ABSG34_14755 [Candidatus Sulfotelmatobacter sp.]